MATADDTKSAQGIRAQPIPIPNQLKDLLRSLLIALQGVQSTTIVACAALKYQAADFDEDIARTLQRNASDRLDVAIHRLEYLLYPEHLKPVEDVH